MHDYAGYEEIMLTGGEPMIHPEIVKQAIKEIRMQTNCPIILYTAKTDDRKQLGEILDLVDGITVTLHEQNDAMNLAKFDLSYSLPRGKDKSFRLNVFEEVDCYTCYSRWKIKDNMKWIKDCPLPEGEVFMRYSINNNGV